MGTNRVHPPRPTGRVPVAIRIRIFGADVEGRAFSEAAQTVEVSRNGAIILTDRNMTPQEEVLIRVESTGMESAALNIGQIRKQPDGFVYGVKLLEPRINMWKIDFVPRNESAAAAGHILLECSKCRLREVKPLEEFEAEVYQVNRCIYYPCRRCRDVTIWKEAAHEPMEREREIFLPQPPPPPGPAPRAGNERRHNRIGCKLLACIRYLQHFDDEVLEVNDLSRGGVCFTTRKYLAPGTRIEIAVPYSPGMENIFLPAELVRFNAVPNKNLYECGAVYIKR